MSWPKFDKSFTSEYGQQLRRICRNISTTTHIGRIHLPLMDGPSIKMCLIKNYYFFHHNLMKLGEVVVHIEYYNFTRFHHILMQKIIVLYQTHLKDVLSVRSRWIWPWSHLNNKSQPPENFEPSSKFFFLSVCLLKMFLKLSNMLSWWQDTFGNSASAYLVSSNQLLL